MLRIEPLDTVHRHLTDDQSRQLDRHLETVQMGRPKEIVTDPWKDTSDEEIEEVFGNLIADSNLPSAILDAEYKELSKLGPRSMIVGFEKRRESLQAYYKHDDPSAEQMKEWFTEGQHHAEIYFADLDSAGIQWRRRGRLGSIEEASKYVVRSTNAGLPWQELKGQVLDNYSLSSIMDNPLMDVCSLFARSKDASVSRNIWGTSLTLVLLGYRMYPIVIAAEKKLRLRSALLGNRGTDLQMTSDFMSLPSGFEHLSMDFSKFDATFSPKLIMISYGCLSELFHESEHSEIFQMASRVPFLRLVTPEGVYTGAHGQPSGDIMTNTGDSIGQHYVTSDLDYFDPLQLQGDDNYGHIKTGMLDNLVDHCARGGLEVHPEKSLVHSDVASYVSRWYTAENKMRLDDRALGGIYSIGRLAVRLKYPERWTDFKRFGLTGAQYYNGSTVSKLANSINHPKFLEVLKYVLGVDKYLSDASTTDYQLFLRTQVAKQRAGVFDDSDNEVAYVLSKL
jgi:hypothetical protein